MLDQSWFYFRVDRVNSREKSFFSFFFFVIKDKCHLVVEIDGDRDGVQFYV